MKGKIQRDLDFESPSDWIDDLLISKFSHIPKRNEFCNKQGARGHRPFQAPLIHKTQKTINMKKKKKILNEKWSQ